MDPLKLIAVKDYMRVDGDGDDDVIREAYEAAREYLKGAGIVETDGNRSRYTLAVHALTLHYYDHRDDVGSESSFPLGLRPVINQLKLSSS